MAKILTSPGKYVQGAGELKKLGTYAKTYGKKALVLVTASGHKRLGTTLEDSFRDSGCEPVLDYFNGECSKTEINRLMEVMKKNGCDLVIGVGGGKILDTAKAVAYYEKVPVLICRLSRPQTLPAAPCPLFIQTQGYLRSICSFRRTRIWF